jgi:hypothetical protein
MVRSSSLFLSLFVSFPLTDSLPCPSRVSRNATPPVDGQSVTCSYCEQHYTYRKGKKVRNQTESLQRSLSSTSSNNG